MTSTGEIGIQGQTAEVSRVDRGRARAGRAASGLRTALSTTSSRARQGVQRNPLGFALSGVGLGMLAGMVAPTGRKEAQAMQPTASRLRRGAESVRASVSDIARQAALEARQVEQQRRPI